jgi:hypothetical protein
VDDVNYLSNVCRLIVELVNDASSPGWTVSSASEHCRAMYAEHHVRPPSAGRLAPLLPMLDAALAAVTDHEPGARPLCPIDVLLREYPPSLVVSNHDGIAHLHYAPDGEAALPWTARNAGAALAYVMTGDVAVTVGRCSATGGCRRYFVDDSRNRSRRFCSARCASRTTVSAYRARRRGSGRFEDLDPVG